MRIRVQSPVTLVTVLGLIVLGASTAPATVGPVASRPFVAPDRTAWQTVEAHGTVEARSAAAREPAWRETARGDELAAGAAVRSGRRGRATLIRGASVLMLEPSSRIELPHDGTDRPLVQDYGSVIYEIERSSRERLRVLTPQLVADVADACFALTVTDDYSMLTVRSGRVEVEPQQTGEPRWVQPGETLRVGSAEDAEVQTLSPAGFDPAQAATGQSDAWRLALLHEERIDRALARLEPNLAAYRYAAERRGYGGLVDLEEVLSHELEAANRSGALLGSSTISGVRATEPAAAGSDPGPGSQP